MAGLVWWGVGALPAFAIKRWGSGPHSVFRESSWVLSAAYALVGIAIFSALAVVTCGLCLEVLRGRRPAVDPSWLASRILSGSVVGAVLGFAGSLLPIAVAYAVARLVSEVGGEALFGRLLLALLAGSATLVVVYSLLVGPLLGLAFPAVADGMGARQALALSVREGISNWGALVGLSFILVAVNLLAQLVGGGYGVIVTVPWTAAVFSAAYQQVADKTPNRTA